MLPPRIFASPPHQLLFSIPTPAPNPSKIFYLQTRLIKRVKVKKLHEYQREMSLLGFVESAVKGRKGLCATPEVAGAVSRLPLP